MTYLPTVSGNDSRFVVYETNIGDGTIGPFTITHNLGTRSVFPVVWKNVAGAALTGALQGQWVGVDFRRDPTDDKNKMVISPDESWGLNEMRVIVIGVVGTSDVTAPTPPTLAAGTPTSSTIPVTVSGATDAVGVAAYNFFLNGTYAGTSSTTSYTYTGLLASTAYNLTAQAVDVAGNPSSTSNVVPVSTLAGSVTNSLTIVANTKPSQLVDWSPQQLSGTYSVGSGGTLIMAPAPTTANGVYLGGVVHTTPVSGVLMSTTVTIGDGGSSLRRTGAAVNGSDATFTNGIFCISCGFGDAAAMQIITKAGNTYTTRASNSTIIIAGDVMKFETTFNGTNYVYTAYKNGALALQWIDTGNVFTPGKYGGAAGQVEWAFGQYGGAGIKGTMIIKDN
jgi:hypothetical protein